MKCNLMFAYGMNTNINNMSIRCPDAQDLGVSTLDDYKFRFAYHADVVKSPGDFVTGILWRITDKCLESLDMLEGYPSYYDRTIVQVKHNDQLVNSWVYFMQPGAIEEHPHSNYLSNITVGYREHCIDLSQIENALLKFNKIA